MPSNRSRSASRSEPKPPSEGGSEPGRNSAKKIKRKGEFAKKLVRMRAAAMMLAGPIPVRALYDARIDDKPIGTRDEITNGVIAPWFTIVKGMFKLTAKGRDEYVEAMDAHADVPETVGPTPPT